MPETHHDSTLSAAVAIPQLQICPHEKLSLLFLVKFLFTIVYLKTDHSFNISTVAAMLQLQFEQHILFLLILLLFVTTLFTINYLKHAMLLGYVLL